VGSSLNQHAAEFSLCNTLVLLLDLSFKQTNHSSARVPEPTSQSIFNSYAPHRLRLAPRVLARPVLRLVVPGDLKLSVLDSLDWHGVEGRIETRFGGADGRQGRRPGSDEADPISTV